MYAPTKVHFGQAAIASLDIPSGNCLFIHSKGAKPEFIEKILASNSALQNDAVVVARDSGEPWTDEVDNFIGANGTNFRSVVAIGGGSTLDFAKAIALIAVSGGEIADYEFGARVIRGALPLYLIPTTCGSGSEVTQYCVINNTATRRKFTLSSDFLRATEAAVDSTLLSEISANTRIVSVLDAVTHCLEAALNKANINHPSQVFALEGLRLFFQFNDKEQLASDLDVLERISLYGGIAISHSRTGLIHTMSAAISPYSELPHGAMNSLLMPTVLRITLSYFRGRLCEIVNKTTNSSFSSDLAAYTFIESKLKKFTLPEWRLLPLNSNPPDIANLVARVAQDKGLPAVSYGPVDDDFVTHGFREALNAA